MNESGYSSETPPPTKCLLEIENKFTEVICNCVNCRKTEYIEITLDKYNRLFPYSGSKIMMNKQELLKLIK